MILETQRLYLRHLKKEDAPFMSHYRNKKEVAKYQSWKKYSEKDAINRIEHCLKIESLNKPLTNYHLGIIKKDDHLLIGDLFVNVINKKTICLGYTLDSTYWHLGYAYEMIQAFLNYMQIQYGFENVICYAYKENIKSIHLLEKLGFEKFEESRFYGDVGYKKKMK